MIARRAKLTLALLILIIAFIGLNSRLFISWGLFSANGHKSQTIELDALQLERIGISPEPIEQKIEQLVANMNNAQQGTHFLLGMVSGLILAQPHAGLTVGIIKEIYDFLQGYRTSNLTSGYMTDAIVDTLFWFAGGLVGFYILSATYDELRNKNIRGAKGTIQFGLHKLFKRKGAENESRPI